MVKEPEIKLFGRKIYLPEHGIVAADECSTESSNGSADCNRCSEESGGQAGREEKQEQTDEEFPEGEVCDISGENDDQNPSQNTNAPSESDDNQKTDNNDESGSQGKSENGEQKTLKKPDKILPCPRCNSMDTKFCYYNNYNVNQPRHFCKSCQRYWTAGGTMRNVPVGAGRRKNKICRHITISDALRANPNAFHNLKFQPNATVLSFGPDSSPCCESTAERRAPNGIANGCYRNGEKVEDCSTRPSANMMNIPAMKGGIQQPGPGIPGVSWPFPPWNSAIPLPTIFPPPGYPVPYYLWNLPPWLSPTVNEMTGAGAGAATSLMMPLGKHSRSGEPLDTGEEGREGQRLKSSIVVPKTLRIDDPEDAAKSSIWSTLGIKYDSMSREGLFKAFQPKGGDAKKQAMAAAAAATTTTTSSLMQVNPAALSRSLKFQETA